MGRGLLPFSESPLPFGNTTMFSFMKNPCVARGATNKEQVSMSQYLWMKAGPDGVIANKGGDQIIMHMQ